MLNQPQKTFMALLFSTLIVVQGKANYRNMSRYCEMSEKLRTDADLRWLYTGEQSGRGRPKKYDGKVDFDKDIDRFEPAGWLNGTVGVFSAVAHSNSLNRAIKVVLLKIHRGSKVGRALLFSTNIKLAAMTLLAYYKARFQIEYIEIRRPEGERDSGRNGDFDSHMETPEVQPAPATESFWTVRDRPER